ncbi:hypothetical protein [Streptomyces fuscigenes]|uniref:hypothetical protein n=1 Tax=Streptomyces fuscigenes TaxID=1528880 RepID=UPI001F15E185|nr:hypothetical protein [Streptomyces fuscigenes]MCF3960313.1 hypothetical protein [Streptomyces fuscigenes]
MSSKAATYAAVYAVLTAAHEGADYWVQRDADARDKGKPGAIGRAACARHVTTYTATQALALLAADRGLRLRLNWKHATAALALSAATHYLADRCASHWAEDDPGAPLLVRAAHAAGKGKWLQSDPGAGPLLDQAWHKVCIGLAAGLAAAGTR